ncbi:MAG: response regulator, partial [Caulobacterales bacterium]|nr:response regulator [Caulobacterales bacterium]
KALLEPLRPNLTIVGDGRQAVEVWSRKPFDVILMDIRMPVMTGDEAMREIRRLEREADRARTPIIALTANAMPDQITGYLESGGDACVAKPVKVRELLGAIMAVLKSPPARESDSDGRAA